MPIFSRWEIERLLADYRKLSDAQVQHLRGVDTESGKRKAPRGKSHLVFAPARGEAVPSCCE